MSLINWRYCYDPNTINAAIKAQGLSNWDGLTSADQIISITYNPDRGCYVVFWRVK